MLSSTLSLSPRGRFHTMSIMIAVDILGCTGSTEERAALLHKTIQLAAELKSTMGNMFSFAAVMNALEMTQVRGRRLCPPHTPPPRWLSPWGQRGQRPSRGSGVEAGKGRSRPLRADSPAPPGCDCFFRWLGFFVFVLGSVPERK